MALLLAAGQSRRFGSDKRLHATAGDLPLFARTLLPWVTVFERVYLTVRVNDVELEQSLQQAQRKHPELASVQLVAASSAAEGMGGSLRDGVRAILAPPEASPDRDSAALRNSADALPSPARLCVGLADMPYVSATTLRALDAALESAAPSILAARPQFHGAAGQPVSFRKQLFERLAHAREDRGARAILRTLGAALLMVPVEDSGVLRDVDRPSDLP